MITDRTITYFAKIVEIDKCLSITFPDLPEARTFVKQKHRNDAPKTAMDCLITALDSRVRDKERFPSPLFKAKGLKPHQYLICTVSIKPYKKHLRKKNLKDYIDDQVV